MTWQEKALAQVSNRRRVYERESSTTRFGPAMKPLKFSATLAYMTYVNAAAEKMVLNRSAFVRRAIAVQAAHVLGIDVHDVLFESPKPRPVVGWPLWAEQAAGAHDDGEGIEAFCPHPGCDGSHLSVPNSGRTTGLP